MRGICWSVRVWCLQTHGNWEADGLVTQHRELTQTSEPSLSRPCPPTGRVSVSGLSLSGHTGSMSAERSPPRLHLKNSPSSYVSPEIPLSGIDGFGSLDKGSDLIRGPSPVLPPPCLSPHNIDHGCNDLLISCLPCWPVSSVTAETTSASPALLSPGPTEAHRR